MYNIALIGNGYWGKILSPYLRRCFRVKRTVTSKDNLEDVWLDREIDAVIIATPIDSHYRLAKNALMRGKHVLVEKPIAMRYVDAMDLQATAKEMGKHLVTEYTLAFSKGIEMIHKMREEIGHISYYEFTTRHLGRFKEFDLYWLLASHWLAVLDMFVPLDHFRVGTFRRNGTETGQLLMDYFGAKAVFNVSLNYPGKDLNAVFYGNKGTAVYDAQDVESVKMCKYEKKLRVPVSDLMVGSKSWQIDESNNLSHSVGYFRDVLDGKAKSNVETAVRVTQTIEKALKMEGLQ